MNTKHHDLAVLIALVTALVDVIDGPVSISPAALSAAKDRALTKWIDADGNTRLRVDPRPEQVSA